MAKAPVKTNDDQLMIAEIKMTESQFFIVGESPLVPHAVSAKSKGSLLFPSPRKNAAEKATSMKHEPYEEFIDACYQYRDQDKTDTRLYMPAGAFHGAMAQAAIDMVGVKKAQVGRLTTVINGMIPIFGVPQIWMTIVRSADMAHTPDVRTLPIIPRWAATITVRFVGSLIKEQSVGNLLGAAGIIVGVGDGRPEKGKLSMGQFRLCSDDDPEYRAIVKQGGRAAQDKALADPAPFDLETEKLLAWFDAEKIRRVASPAPMMKRGRKPNDVAAKSREMAEFLDRPLAKKGKRNGGKDPRVEA